ncbi:Hypothetical protein FKW44_010956, partial [Caligus rogercresseyi]
HLLDSRVSSEGTPGHFPFSLRSFKSSRSLAFSVENILAPGKFGPEDKEDDEALKDSSDEE